MMTLLTSPHRIRIPNRSSTTDIPSRILRTEMTGLESQEEDAPKRILFLKPMS
jgi:hypothetical protein